MVSSVSSDDHVQDVEHVAGSIVCSTTAFSGSVGYSADDGVLEMIGSEQRRPGPRGQSTSASYDGLCCSMSLDEVDRSREVGPEVHWILLAQQVVAVLRSVRTR